jgi:tRNA(Ile)-lysidine synthase
VVDPALQTAIDAVPPGPWAVGVSGGADSVALLSLLRTRADLQLIVVHLDHETRAGASAADAAFVRELCDAWRIPCVVETRSAVERDGSEKLERRPPSSRYSGEGAGERGERPGAPDDVPLRERNLSARYRQARLQLFRRIVTERGLRGVILAHHADDQAETIFHRLLRGSPPAGLTGMAREANLAGLTVLRPLLAVHRETLRAHLHVSGQPWREDESNASPRYARNRIRRLLAARPALVAPLIDLGECCRELTTWLDATTPTLPDRFRVADIRAMPPPLARRALSRWLRERTGIAAEPATVDTLLVMAMDAASSPRRNVPGGALVRRRGGLISCD